MQTFVPYTNFDLCSACLDRQRLGKQRVEVLQILNAITGNSNGWVNHPATKMWQHNPAGLAAYGVYICTEWIRRGYTDTCREKISNLVTPDDNDLPVWWGDKRVHASHRSNLLRKDPEHYRQYWPNDSADLEYYWPV